MMVTRPTAAYLYCVVRSDRPPSLARAPRGVPAATRPEAHAVGRSLWIVAASVPLDIYGPASLEGRLGDLDWVSRVALAHEALVEHVAGVRTATVIPTKLFTMFSSLDKAVADVASRRAAILQATRRIAGAAEWGVRVFHRPRRPSAKAPAAKSGAEFLRARKQARDAGALARTAAADGARTALSALRRHARDLRLRSPRDGAAPDPPILDAAFLVSVSARGRFEAEARRQSRALEKAGAALVLTGPWPAYNFVVPGERS